MQNLNREIHCVFYSHVWALQMLEQVDAGDLSEVLVVEGAINSNLAPMLDAPTSARAGLRELLKPGSILQDAATQFKGYPFSMVLACHPPIPVGAIASAIANSRFSAGPQKRIILMVNIIEAQQLAPVFIGANRFSCLWDVAEPPTLLLAQIGELLAKYQCVGADNWGGIKFYSHPKRPGGDAKEAIARYSEILSEYPGMAMP